MAKWWDRHKNTTDFFDDETAIPEMQSLIENEETIVTERPSTSGANAYPEVAYLHGRPDGAPPRFTRATLPSLSSEGGIPDVELRSILIGDQEGASHVYTSSKDLEREETVKCVFSSLLFFAIIAAFFIVAFVLNPEM